MAITDKSLHFGLQNFLNVATDETDVTYNYYCFVNKRNSILIMRTNKTTTEVRYYATTGTFATVWAAKSTYTYVLPNQLVDQNV